MKCFQVGYMEMFTTATAAKTKVIRTAEKTEEVAIYYACRQPDDGKDMIRRDKCHVSQSVRECDGRCMGKNM